MAESRDSGETLEHRPVGRGRTHSLGSQPPHHGDWEKSLNLSPQLLHKLDQEWTRY